MTYELIVTVEGEPHQKTLTLLGTKDEAKARAREIAENGLFFPIGDDELVFYPARRVREVMVRPQPVQLLG